ncbi:MAG: dockerin type I repeat-containing protein, partial [Muribaculaceae bacterium]|nr:dockerin type I repeat-containing protein [Muribaculaceae bacterium]
KKGEPAQTYIRNCSITMPEGEIQNEDNDCALMIENAYIHLTDGYISTPPALTLNNCYISNPVGGHVSDYGEICANGSNGMYWGEIEIKPGTAPSPVIVGDVNEDGEVDVRDITALIDIIMNSGTGAAADVNEDGDIDVRDITALIDIIMNN